MSFQFTASGTPNEVIAEVGQQAAATPQLTVAFADAINKQLSGLPTDASVRLECSGHTGWGAAQTSGEISMHVVMQVRTPKAP